MNMRATSKRVPVQIQRAIHRKTCGWVDFMQAAVVKRVHLVELDVPELDLPGGNAHSSVCRLS